MPALPLLGRQSCQLQLICYADRPLPVQDCYVGPPLPPGQVAAVDLHRPAWIDQVAEVLTQQLLGGQVRIGLSVSRTPTRPYRMDKTVMTTSPGVPGVREYRPTVGVQTTVPPLPRGRSQL